VPLRLIEVTIPTEALPSVPGLLEEAHVIATWTSAAGNEASLLSVLVDARHTEGLSDILVRRFGTSAGFRLLLLSVEATLPPVEEPSEEVVETARATVGPNRISREELYDDIAHAGRLTGVYVVMVALSTVVAAVGLIRGDVAIIIGAMVIAPLLGPNMALSLASTLGDLELVKRSLKAIGAGVAIAAALSLLLGAVLGVDPSSQQLMARTRADMADVVLALAAGAAGSLAFTSGVPAVVVGVMVAVALLPPLVAAGLLAGAGYLNPAMGAVTLALTNVTCVNLAAVATFLIQRVRPRTWWETERAKAATRRAVAIWLIMLGLLVALILSGYVGTM